jgi:hypothetical protein
MEGLKELVSASFARHGIECPAGDSKLAEKRATVRVGTAAVGGPAERSSAAASDPTNAGYAAAQTTRLAEPATLPDHNYRKSLQGDPAP